MDQFVGIPGTIAEETRRLRWQRGPDKGNARIYTADVADGILWAIVSQDPAGTNGRLLWHISVSHRDKSNRPDRCPNWDELKHAAYRLIQVDVPLQLIFPRRSAPYVNDYPTCLHLWEVEQDIDL